MNTQKVARFLGWFSVALGATQVLAAPAVERLLGVKKRRGTLRLFGAREIVTGVGILTARDPTPWLWARVAGDALDLAALGAALGARGSRKAATSGVLAGVLGVTALDLACARRLSAARLASPVATAALDATTAADAAQAESDAAREDRLDESLMESFPSSDPPAHRITPEEP